jgi:ribonuclease Z
MMKLTFLGTGGSTPTKDRNLPAVAIEHEGEIYLFDCGEGTQRQALAYSVNISKIKCIFITHAHGDHIIGLAGLVRTMALNRRMHPLTIYVPAGDEDRINVLLTFDKALIGYKIDVKGVKSGQVLKGDGFNITAFKLNHTISTFGYVFEEESKLRFMKEKSKKLGLKGEMFGKLSKNGSIKINGKTIRLKDVTFTVPGKKVVYATDTMPAETTVKAAAGADVLIHEASYAKKLKELAKERAHSTSEDAARVAKKAKCKRLILFHISARYKNTNELLKDAKAVFKNSTVATDGMIINL